RCAAPGAQAGCAFFAPGFFAQAKKGGSRRDGAKALDLDVGEIAAGQDPPYGAVTGNMEEQERLAALAPSSALRAPSPASGRRAIRPGLPQAGEGLFDRVSRKREKGWSTGSPAGGRGAEVAPLEGPPQRQAAAARRRPAARPRRRPLDCPRSPDRGTTHGLALSAAGAGRLCGRAEDNLGGTGRAVSAGGPGPGHRRGAGAAGPAHRQPEPQREFHHRPGRAAPAARGGRGPARAADRRRRIAAGLGRFRVTVLSVNLNKVAVL